MMEVQNQSALDALRSHAKALIAAKNPSRAAKALGVSRSAVLQLASGARVHPGTVLVAIAALAAREQQPEDEVA